ncbi:MAG TPA: type II toxin-antitoxin system prevent-host-death family antitoxin [Bacilli bacterium]
MKVSSTEIQNNFGKYLKFAEAGEEIIVTKNGKDIVKVAACHETTRDWIMEDAAAYKTNDWVTYEAFLELVENSEQRYELIDGVIYNLASPSYKHQHAVHELHGAFYIWFKGKPCTPLTSPFDVTFFKQEDNICVVQPDILVICDIENIDQKGKYKGTPALVVEVLSPSTRGKDLIKKLDLYKRSGVKEYWVVDPMNEQITIYSLADNDIADHKSYHKGGNPHAESSHFRGLKVLLEDLFT